MTVKCSKLSCAVLLLSLLSIILSVRKCASVKLPALILDKICFWTQHSPSTKRAAQLTDVWDQFILDLVIMAGDIWQTKMRWKSAISEINQADMATLWWLHLNSLKHQFQSTPATVFEIIMWFLKHYI